MRTIYPSVFKKPEVVNELRRLHDNFVLVPANKASNNIVFIWKNYYYGCLLNELEFTFTCGNPTYTRTNLTKDEILQNYLLSTFQKIKISLKYPTVIGFQNCIKLLTNKDTLLASKYSTKPLSL
jgi:hypothetical protein